MILSYLNPNLTKTLKKCETVVSGCVPGAPAGVLFWACGVYAAAKANEPREVQMPPLPASSRTRVCSTGNETHRWKMLEEMEVLMVSRSVGDNLFHILYKYWIII